MVYEKPNPVLQNRSRTARWFYIGMALLMIITSIVGFAPGMVSPANRRGTVSPLVAIHGLVCLAWLVLFAVQSELVANRHIAWHRRLGTASVFLFALLVPLTYSVTVTMVRRGFDLSGDQRIDPRPGFGLDAATASVFNFGALLAFTLLVVGALWVRRRPAFHKRLMLFANIQLMGAPITHLLGHAGLLTPPAVVLVVAVFVLIAVLGDTVACKRLHPLTAGLSLLTLAMLPLEGALIGPSSMWHSLVSRLAGRT